MLGDAFGTCVYAEDQHGNRDVLFDRVDPEAGRILKMLSLSVHPDYRGKGVATCLSRYALERAAATDGLRCDGAYCGASSPHTRKIFDQMGFETYAEVAWEDLKSPDDGKPLYKDMPSPSLAFMYKRLLKK